MQMVGHDDKSQPLNTIFVFLKAHCLYYDAAKEQV